MPNQPSSTRSAGSRKRQQRIYFRSLALPPSGSVDASENGEKKDKPDYCPHFLAALQLVAHVMVPVRKALIHFYVSYRNKDVEKLEWLTLLAFGRLFRDLITASNSSGESVMTGGSDSQHAESLGGDVDPSALSPVNSERFFPVLYTCLLKHDLNKWPKDATEAVRVLLDCLKCCAQTLPVVHQLWSALLDKACLGLIVKQSLVGRRKQEKPEDTEVKQRSVTEQVIMWCPHELSIKDLARMPKPTKKDLNANGEEDEEDEPVPTLQQLLEEEFKKRPLSTTNRKPYDFDKQSYDFEVEIPTKFLDKNDDDENPEELWKTTRSMQFAALTGYLFLGIDRGQKQEGDDDTAKIDRTELAVPPRLNLTGLCSKSKTMVRGRRASTSMPPQQIYELVGGALYDEGEYVAVLKDFAAVQEAEESSQSNHGGGDDSDEEEEETWKLMEAEETIPMSEGDVLEFLKGEGDDDDEDDDDDDDEDFGPCGTLAVYKLVAPPTASGLADPNSLHDEMNQLLSDIVISQVSGALNSKTDFYIEEEVYEEEIIED